MGKLVQELKVLIDSQLINWTLARENYAGLAHVITRNLKLPGGALLKIQFNPGRIRSSTAKIDAKSIQERPCFLCGKNRPREQQGILYREKYLILLNPFPVFQSHLTIPSIEHIPQLIETHFETMLHLAFDLDGYTVFYNGPQCGASAPDHFHFQAGKKDLMPIEADFKNDKFTKLSGTVNQVQIYKWQHYSRNIITLKSADAERLADVFQDLLKSMHQLQPDAEEPMINLLAYFEDNQYVVHVIPRAQHRADCYFAEGEKQILTSPASVDLGGVLITPREEDFEKITVNDVLDIFGQVCMKEAEIDKIIKDLVGL